MRPAPFCQQAIVASLLLVLLPLAALAQAPAPEASCPIPGDRFDWTTDYCLALTQTEDEALAGPCIDQELQRRFVNACEGPAYYKQGLCGLALQAGTYAGSADDCMADGTFAGPTVRRKLAAAGKAAPSS